MSTNKIHYTPGTSRTFKNTGGDTTFTLKNISSGAGRLSAQWDRGAGSLAARFKVEVCLKYGSAIAISAVARFYLHSAETASANVDGGASDAAITAETQFNNFDFIGSVAGSTNAVGPFYKSFIVEVYGRYLSLGFWNIGGQATDNADGTSFVVMTPVPDDIQAAA